MTTDDVRRRPTVAVTGVSKQFSRGVTALDGIDLTSAPASSSRCSGRADAARARCCA